MPNLLLLRAYRKSKSGVAYCLIAIATCLVVFNAAAQRREKEQPAPAQPKLVVGIVVDQMRADYVYRFWDKFSAGGFRRLVGEGFACRNLHYNYMPTYTGPGHASIYTGTTPSVHGIVANDWYNRETRSTLYCAEDATVDGVGGGDGKTGKMSPRNLLASTMTDELRIATRLRGKVVGISLKDRGAILPAGHTPNGAYWFSEKEGNFITSTYYMTDVPTWVRAFNEKQLPQKYLSEPWNTLLPIAQYTESADDDNAFEGTFKGEAKPVFPHDLPAFAKAYNSTAPIKATPWGNTIVKDFALAALEAEKLGKDEFTDFLAVSFSSTDYVGHQYGPQSVELEDTYLRLDRDLEEFFNALDKAVGKQNVVVFLTADHGAAEVPAYLASLRIPSGRFDGDKLQKDLKEFGRYTRSDSAVWTVMNQEVYLNPLWEDEAFRQKIVTKVRGYAGVANVWTQEQLSESRFAPTPIGAAFARGIYPKRSGDIIYNLDPAWLEHGPTGTSHGTAYSYDTHVPLYFWGWKIQNGATDTRLDIIDIAPTICAWLNIPFPNGCTGNPIQGKIREGMTK